MRQSVRALIAREAWIAGSGTASKGRVDDEHDVNHIDYTIAIVIDTGNVRAALFFGAVGHSAKCRIDGQYDVYDRLYPVTVRVAVKWA